MKHNLFFILLTFSSYIFANLTQQEYDAIVFKHFEKIVFDYNENKDSAENNKDKLVTGYWYAKDYLDLLIKHKQNKRKNWLLQKDSFRNWFVDLKSPLELKNKGYSLKKNHNSADIFNNFGTYLIFIDCGMAIQIAHYKALLEILGENDFNFIFNSINKPLLSTDINNIAIAEFMSIKDVNDFANIGAHSYISNHPLYAMKHVYGNNNGFHVLVSEIDGNNTKFIGFGLPNKGLTKAEINDYLVKTFNELPTDNLFVEASTWQNEMSERAGFALIKFSVLPEIKISSINDQNAWHIFEQKLKEKCPLELTYLAPVYVNQIKNQREEIVQSSLGSFFVDINKIQMFLFQSKNQRS